MDPKESVTTLNISLPAALKNYIERQVQDQAYTSASEFIRMLIRNHQELQGRLNRLEDLLVDGVQVVRVLHGMRDIEKLLDEKA